MSPYMVLSISQCGKIRCLRHNAPDILAGLFDRVYLPYMKNNYAWAIIVLVLIVAGGAIWFMTDSLNKVPANTATITTGTNAGTGTTHTTTTVKKGTATGSGTASTDIRPKITSLMPAQGKPAAVAQVKGMNFDSTTNVITFGPSMGLHRKDGSADNEVATIASSDGMTLSFSVPTAIESGELCDQSNVCKTYGPKGITAGTYMVTVVNKNGVSNEMPFTVTN